MTDPIEELMNEHRTIEKVLTALAAAEDHPVDLAFYQQVVDFLAHFADGCHHDKEEKRLFPSMEEKGMTQESSLLGLMYEEHETGRAQVALMRLCIEEGNLEAVQRVARDVVALLRDHIEREDHVLFPMARDLLSDEELARLGAAFATDQNQACGRYRRLADELLSQTSTAGC